MGAGNTPRVQAIRAELNDLVRDLGQLVELLNSYAGAGTQATPRSFAFVQDPHLRQIVERDSRELSQVLMPDYA